MKKHFIVLILLTLLIYGCRSSIVDVPSSYTFQVSFHVAQNSHVKLTIENSYNTIVKSPVDNDMSAGYYENRINSSDMPAGIYYATVECKGINSNYYNVITTRILIIK